MDENNFVMQELAEKNLVDDLVNDIKKEAQRLMAMVDKGGLQAMDTRYLFRGKRKDNGELVYGSPHKLGKDRVFIVSVNIDELDKEYITFDEWVEIYPETLSQATGMKDINRKLIFEGDIIKSDGSEFVSGSINLVRWNKYGFWYVEIRSLDTPSDIDEDLELYEVAEFNYIAGNIYQNPELLAEK